MNRRMFFGALAAAAIGARHSAERPVFTAGGGFVTRSPSVVIIGKHGPEYVIPLSSYGSGAVPGAIISAVWAEQRGEATPGQRHLLTTVRQAQARFAGLTPERGLDMAHGPLRRAAERLKARA